MAPKASKYRKVGFVSTVVLEAAAIGFESADLAGAAFATMVASAGSMLVGKWAEKP